MSAMRKTECAELNGSFHFSPHENILSIARLKTSIILYSMTIKSLSLDIEKL